MARAERRRPPGIGSNRACLSGRLRKYVRFPFGSCFFRRRQRTLRVETLSPDTFGIGAGCTRGGLVEVRSSALDLGRSLQPLRVLERLVFGVRELAEQKALLLKCQRPSKGQLNVLVAPGRLTLIPQWLQVATAAVIAVVGDVRHARNEDPLLHPLV